MSNTTKPFTPSEIMTAGKIARFAMQFDHFDDVITPVLDQLVELYPQGKGYDPEEAYMQYLTPAADAMFGKYALVATDIDFIISPGNVRRQGDVAYLP